MDDGQHEAAWQRIEAALARLDTAARDAAARDTATQPALAAQLREEQARHAALRGALRETLGQIDALIATHTQKVAGPDANAPDANKPVSGDTA